MEGKDWATLIIATCVVVIALNQWRVAKAKLKLDLFDKRYEVYLLFREFLDQVRDGGPLDHSRQAIVANFRNSIPKAYFLFGNDIGDYFEQAKIKAVELGLIEQKLRETHVRGPDDRRVEQTTLEALTWFDEASKQLRERFQPHMGFGNWSE